MPSIGAGLQADVDEALRLMRMSKYSLYDDSDRRQGPADPIGEIYTRIRDDYLRTRKSVYTWPELQHLCGIGFSVRLPVLSGWGKLDGVFAACADAHTWLECTW